MNANSGMEIKSAQEKQNALYEELCELKELLKELDKQKVYNFKDENGRYVTKCRKVFYKLLAMGVPCIKAGGVVELIITDLLGARVNDLPSYSTCRNMLVEAGMICKAQIYELFSNNLENVCLAHDGSVKKRNELQSFGIHMNQKFVLIGIDKLVSKSHEKIAQSFERLLDEMESIAIKILGEDGYDEDRWKNAWNKVNCTISDMARVNPKVNHAIQDILNKRYNNDINVPEESTIKIQSLYCLLHLLSGWADAIKEGFNKDKKMMKMKVEEGGEEQKNNANHITSNNDMVEEKENDQVDDDNYDDDDEEEKTTINNQIKIKKSLAAYKVELAPSHQKQYSKNAFDAVRESFKFYAANSDYELNKSKEIKYTLYNMRADEEEKGMKNEDMAKKDIMTDPTKGFKPSVGTRSASSLYNAPLLLLFMNYARLFFENLVIVKGGENKLNKFEVEMLKLCRCRETHLQLLVMSVLYEILIKPTFMAIKSTEEIKNISDAVQLVVYVDQLLYSAKENTANFIDGMVPTMFEDDFSEDEKGFRILSSTLVSDYLNDDEDEVDDDDQINEKPIVSEDNRNLRQVLEEIYLPTLSKHDQAKWRVLHQEADRNSRQVMEEMMKVVLVEIEILHIRRTNYLRKGSELMKLSKDKIAELSCAPVHNDRIEESFGKYTQYHSIARNSSINTKETIVLSKINNLNGYLDQLEEEERVDKVIENAVSWRSDYVKEEAKKDMDVEKERAELLAKSIENAKQKSRMKHQQQEESLAKTKNRITKEDVDAHVRSLRTKKERVQYYKSILDNYKKVQELKEEIETKLKIKLTWSEGGKTKTEDTFKNYVYSIIDYYQPGR